MTQRTQRVNTSALVVLSGGQDSTTCLYWTKEHFDTVHAVSFDYGQRHNREVDAARVVAAMANVSFEAISVGPVLRGTSPLTDRSVQLETYRNYESMDAIIGERVELTFVPMRNAFFLTLAANTALSKGCFDVVTGVCQQDNANYPDCRSDFIEHQEGTINMALGLMPRTFKIHTPLMQMSKADSIAMARRFPGCWEALAFSHTCYAGEFPPCGKCHACVLRAHGFAEAGEVDPLIERAISVPVL